MRFGDYLRDQNLRSRHISYNLLTASGASDGTPASDPRQKIKVTFTQAMALILPYSATRIVEQVKSVLPLALYLCLFQLLILRQPVEEALALTGGLAAVILGLAIFMEGLNVGLMPFGKVIGDNLPKKARLFVVLLIIGLLGVGVTFAEPAIGALQAFGAQVNPEKAPYLYEILNRRATELVILVGAGVGLAAILGTIRFIRGWSLKPLILITLLPTLALTGYFWLDDDLRVVLGLAWDCGAVTTGPVTVPLVLSLGIGIAMAAGKGNDSLSGFGVVTLASLFPILAVLILTLFVRAQISPQEIIAAAQLPTAQTSEVTSMWAATPWQEIILGVRAILPLLIFLMVVLKLVLRSHVPNPLITSYGLVLSIIGMCVFNIGLTYGLGAIGAQTGSALPAAFMSLDVLPSSPIYAGILGYVIVIAFAFILGFGATLAEPALNALGLTVQNLTNGAFKKSMLMYSVSFGVACGIALGVCKIIFNLDLASLIIPLYLIAIVLTLLSTESFVNVAWDSAGVTTGPVTVPLVLAMGMGLGDAVSAIEGFGILSMASIGPIISVMSMGLFIQFRQKRQAANATNAEALPEALSEA